MGILWLIIKIILFILLLIIGILIVSIIVILMAPIRYDAYLEKYDDLSYDIRVYYLGVIKAHFYMEKGVKNHEIKALWKILYEEKYRVQDKTNEDHVQDLDETNTTSLEEKVDEPKGLKSMPSKSDVSEESIGEVDLGKEEQKKTKVKQSVKRQTNRKVKKEINTPVIDDISEGVKEVGDDLKEETEGTLKKLDAKGVQRLFLNRTFAGVLKAIYRCLKYIFKRLMPNEFSFECIIGRRNPADTGELMAKLSLLYPFYAPYGNIQGDYEEECLQGGFLAHGHFRIISIVNALVILLLNREVRRYIRMILAIRKEERHAK